MVEIEHSNNETDDESGEVDECEDEGNKKVFVIFLPNACVQKCAVVILVIDAPRYEERYL